MDHDLSPEPGMVSALAAPALDPIFERPTLLETESAWHGHVPFAHWLVAASRPAMLVELGTHNGVSYAAMCEQVRREGLSTRCFAVDTWAGDEHAGFYGEDVFATLSRFHAQRYGTFSRLLRSTFDEALPYIPDGAVDLLHIDGRHRYEDVAHDFATWTPKLSARAVVLFHDTNVREREFGVWRLWAELRERHPSFEFLHAYGLGVLLVGAEAPAELAALCALDAAGVARVRERFSLLGERGETEQALMLARRFTVEVQGAEARAREWGERLAATVGDSPAKLAVAEAERRSLRLRLSAAKANVAALERDRAAERATAAGEREAAARREAAATAARTAEAAREEQDHRAELARRSAEWEAAARRAHGEAAASVRAAWSEVARLREDRRLILGSTAWRITQPLRAGLRMARPGGPGEPRAESDGAPMPALGALHLGMPEDAQDGRAQDGRAQDGGAQDGGAQDGGAQDGATAAPANGSSAAAAPADGAADGGAPARARAAAAREAGSGVPATDEAQAGTDGSGERDAHEGEAHETGGGGGGDAEAGGARADADGIGGDKVGAAGAMPRATPARTGRRGRILFLSGEAHTPGSVYRVERYAATARALGWEAEALGLRGVDDGVLAGADVVVLWRVAWEGHIEGIVEVCRRQGSVVVFDVDDLMIRPELATIEVIDGIRSQRFSEDGTREFFARVRRTMDASDLVTVTTEELAGHVRELQQIAHVLPNGWDAESLVAARRAVRQRRDSGEGEGLLRIGYAGGSRTHQRDFGLAVGAVAALLARRPEARLVLFRDPSSGEGVVLAGEYPELKPVAAQIEWRDMVPLALLPAEMARFDINLAPLELGNPFCEAKSELKWWEAALVEVPTVASPTGPFARAIEDGRTGLLADGAAAWAEALERLAADPALRARMALDAYHAALAGWGPNTRAEALQDVLSQIAGGREGARGFELGLRRAGAARAALPALVESEVLLVQDGLRDADITVVIPVYNYAEYVVEALESVAAQTLRPLDLVVVDDGSGDESVPMVLDWVRANAPRFNRLMVRRHLANAGLGFARNSGFAAAETPFVLPLDADNRLAPGCCARLLAAMAGGAAFAYPQIRSFGDSDAVFGVLPFSAGRLMSGNYVDAMALVAKWAWAAGGGYDHVRFGWEDYDFWCRLVERGLWGEAVPEVLAEYRVHRGSMIHTQTEQRGNKRALVEDMERRHPWLRIAGKRML